MIKAVRMAVLAGVLAAASGCMVDEAASPDEASDAEQGTKRSRPYEINFTYFDDAAHTHAVGGEWFPCHGPRHAWGVETAYFDKEMEHCSPGEP